MTQESCYFGIVYADIEALSELDGCCMDNVKDVNLWRLREKMYNFAC